MTRLFPIITWLPNYNREDAVGDAIAGLTVGAMAIPQSMAYAAIAGLPIYFGKSPARLLARSPPPTSHHPILAPTASTASTAAKLRRPRALTCALPPAQGFTRRSLR